MSPAPPDVAPDPMPARWEQALEWGITLLFCANLTWTTLCLGGYLAETLVISAWGVWAMAALAAVRLAWRPTGFNWVSVLPVPFLIFALGSVLWLAPAQWLAWREWLLWFQMWLVFVVLLHCGRSRAQTWTIVATIVGLGLVGAAMAAYQRWVDPKWMMLGREQAAQFVGRSAGMFGIPNSLAGWFEVIIPGCLVLLGSRATTLAAKVLCGWLAVVFLVALVLTGSRGGWIATAAAVAAWPLVTGRDWRRSMAGLLVALGVMALALTAVYHGSEYARVRIDPFLEGKFEQSRPIIWKVGVQLWQDAPWFGTGAASYNTLFERYRPAHFRPQPDWTHNDYLNTLSDYGVFGFALWLGAGAAILVLGWRSWRQARGVSRTAAGGLLESWRWRLALWLGWLAYGVHLAVDFHTKIPALVYLGAAIAALMLRRANGGIAGAGVRWGALAVGAAALGVGLGVAHDLYRAEAIRFAARRAIDRVLQGHGTLDNTVPRGIVQFEEAVKIHPGNGQAWGDLAYATALSWHVTRGNVQAIGERAERAARAALARSAVVSEFWIHQGVALDMQGRATEAGAAFREALTLAPNSAEWHYYYAHHLSGLPDRKTEALRAVETCLTLDPSNPQAEALRARLVGNR